MTYSNRLKITQEDYKTLDSGFIWFLSQESVTREDQLKRFFDLAKEKGYTNTRVIFHFYHSLVGYSMRENLTLYSFLRSLNLTDNQIESACKAILKDKLREYWQL